MSVIELLLEDIRSTFLFIVLFVFISGLAVAIPGQIEIINSATQALGIFFIGSGIAGSIALVLGLIKFFQFDGGFI